MSDDSDIVVNQDYFGVADATSTADDIAVSPGYFGGAISDSELGEIYTLTYDVNTQTIILTDTDGDNYLGRCRLQQRLVSYH